MSRNRDHLAWLDLLRVGAALAVVVLHVAAELVVSIPDLDSPLWLAGNVFDSLSRWCIGIFIMVSGALLLEPSSGESVGEFYRKRVRRVLIPTIVWSVAYSGYAVMTGRPMTWTTAARLIWEGRPWYHMWYLFMILGLYAVTPALRLYIGRADPALRWTVIFLAFAGASAWDLYFAIRNGFMPRNLPTMFIPFIGYYLIGYELRRLAPFRARHGLLWGAVSLGAIVTIVGTRALVGSYGIGPLGLCLYEYLSPNVIVMSVGLFCLASSVELGAGENSGPWARIVAWTSPLTLGIYLWHPMMIEALRGLGLSVVGTGSVLGVPMVAIPAFGASAALSWIMSKTPLLRRSIGL